MYNPNRIVSDCCGSNIDDEQLCNGYGVCPTCKEDCVYVTQEEFDRCDECNGEGSVEKNFPATETTLEFDAPVVCMFCEGTGKVIRLATNGR